VHLFIIIIYIEDTQVNGSILYHPLQLNSALYQHEEMKQHIKLLNEADVIREVLFLLKGCEGVLFKYDENEDHFIVRWI
jgi:hypothetical protein